MGGALHARLGCNGYKMVCSPHRLTTARMSYDVSLLKRPLSCTPATATLASIAKPPTPFFAGLLQAVLLEQDLLSLKDLSAVIVCDGRRGDNLIRQYDHGMAITLQVGPLLFALCSSACCLLGLKLAGQLLAPHHICCLAQRHCSQALLQR